MLSDWRRERARLMGCSSGTPGGREWAHSLCGGVERACVLVARPDVAFTDAPLYERSIILVLDHSAHGTTGIALNRLHPRAGPTHNKLRDIVDDSQLVRVLGEIPLHFGGTSTALAAEGEASQLWTLARTELDGGEESGSAEAVPLLPGLQLESAVEVAKQVAAGQANPSDFHFFVGCSEWSAGELEDQIEAGGWLTAACSLETLVSIVDGDESPDEKHEAALGWFHLEELEEELDDGYDYIVSELEHADANQRVQSCEGLWERIIDVTITNGGHTIKEGDGRSTADDHNGIPRLSLASTVVDSLSMWIELCEMSKGLTATSVVERAYGLLAASALSGSGNLDEHLTLESEMWAKQIGKAVEQIAAEVERALADCVNGTAAPADEIFGGKRSEEEGQPTISLHQEEGVESLPAWVDAEEVSEDSLPHFHREEEHNLLRRLIDGEDRDAKGSNKIGSEQVHLSAEWTDAETTVLAQSPRLTLHLLRTMLIREGRAVIKDTPTDLALNLNPLAIGLRSPLLALARNVRHARRSGRDGGREVQMDSLTFGVIMLLLAERLGLPSRLVQTNDEELILQVCADEQEEPLYVALTGEACGRLLMESDLLTAVKEKMGIDEDAVPIVEMMIVSPLEVGARLSHLWSKRYKAAGDSGRASFWEVQRLVLERLQMHLDGNEEDLMGMMVRVHRNDDFGI